MIDRAELSAQLCTAITLLGGARQLLEDLPATRRVDAERLLQAATTRMMRVVYALEPQRAKVAAR